MKKEDNYTQEEKEVKTETRVDVLLNVDVRGEDTHTQRHCSLNSSFRFIANFTEEGGAEGENIKHTQREDKWGLDTWVRSDQSTRRD